MKKVVVSAPGKIHFMGEHAVVYGKPALLSAINLRLTVCVESLQAKEDVIISEESSSYLKEGIAVLKNTLGVIDTTLRITITSDIPSGYHLGSSAALAVALSGAFLAYYKESFDKEHINTLAYTLEKIAHGNPSGGDNTAVTYGGFLQFIKKSETEKIVEPLPYPFPPFFDHFFLINTGKPESTKEMVTLVRNRFEDNPSFMQTVWNVNEKATAMIREAIRSRDEKLLLAGIRIGEKSLEDMGVVSTQVQSFIHAVEHCGGVAKILGGGGQKNGVGYLLGYIPSDNKHGEKEMDILLRQYAYTKTTVRLGEEGVKLESIKK